MSLDIGTLTAYLELDDKKVDQVTEKLPGKLTKGGVAMIAAAGVIAVGVSKALVDGINRGLDLDDAKAHITAELGLTEKESARIGGVAGKLFSENYGDSIEDVNDSVASVVSSIDGMRGATAKSIGDMTAKAINFNAVFGVETARTTQVVGQLIKSGLVKDANEGFDLLVAASQKVPKAVREDLLDALDEYSPFLKQLGLSGDQAFNLLAASAAKGAFGLDKTGDALKEFSIRATDLTDTNAQAALKNLGISGTKAADDLLAGGQRSAGALFNIAQALRGVTDPGKQAQLATALFGTQMEDLNKGEIPKFLDSLVSTKDVLGDTSGAADKMGKTLNGSTKKGWETISRTWDGITSQLGTALVPVLNVVGDILQKNPAILYIVAATLGVLAAAFVVVTVATWAMNAALLANPFVWIVVAIIALIAIIILLVMNWDTVVKFLTDVWNGFVTWIVGVLTAFGDFWIGIWNSIVNFAVDLWNGFVALIIGIIVAYFTIYSAIWNAIASFFIGIWQGMVSFVTDVWNGFINWIIGAAQAYVGMWIGIWNGVASFFSGLWNGIVTGVKTVFNNMLSFLKGIPGAIMGFFGGIGDWLYNSGRNLIDGLLKGIKSLAGTIGSFFLNLLPSWIVVPFKAALGIHSPSTVFAGFAGNIVDGMLVGFDDRQDDLDRRVGRLVTPPPTGSQSGAGGGSGGTAGSSGAAPVQAILDLRGATVGWNPDEVKAKMDREASIAQTLSGVDEDVPVA